MIWAVKCLSMVLLLSGCVTTNKNTLAVSSLLEKPAPILQWRSDSFVMVDVPSVSEIFQLSEDRQNHFLDYYYAEANLPVAEHIRLYNFDISMQAHYQLTQKFTSEFAIRSFIQRYPEKCLALLAHWARDSNLHVRRLVSEGTRPRLPWASRLPEFIQDPSPVIAY